jgi:hypothetical protein
MLLSEKIYLENVLYFVANFTAAYKLIIHHVSRKLLLYEG